MKLTLTPQAKSDLREIARYIAKDSPMASRRWVTGMQRRLGQLREMPHLGIPRDDVRPGLRLLVLGNYLVLHRISEREVEVVRVMRGAREWQALI